VCWLTNNLGIFLALAEISKTIASHSATVIWHVQNQPHRAFSTLSHHSLDSYGGKEMVQQQCHACVCWLENNLDFGLALAEICQPFCQPQCNKDMACPKSATQSLPKL
jgi:hypothetical protein